MGRNGYSQGNTLDARLTVAVILQCSVIASLYLQTPS